MAEKKSTIVIKKITIGGAGAHGGAWKVAFADFMTAMMCFFLVMWLLATSSEQSKKAVADYFSTPSVIEYNFQNYGAELTLEKLFLDLINEPLKTLESFIEPMEHTPNIMSMGMNKVVTSYLADQLGDVSKDVQISQDAISFEIPDAFLFVKGTSDPAAQFVPIMEKVKGITAGLQGSDITITSIVYQQSIKDGDMPIARNVAIERLDIITKKVEASLENEGNDVTGRAVVRKDLASAAKDKANSGAIKFEIKQKKPVTDSHKPQNAKNQIFEKPTDPDHTVYDNFVKKLSNTKKSSREE